MSASFVVAAIAMLVCLAPAGVVIIRGAAADAVVGYEFLTAVLVMVFALLAEGFGRPGLFEFPVLLVSTYGALLAVLFFTFQAPDVTLSELTVGAVVLPVILLLAISKVREREDAKERDQ